jgi:hypothetical protein
MSSIPLDTRGDTPVYDISERAIGNDSMTPFAM